MKIVYLVLSFEFLAGVSTVCVLEIIYVVCAIVSAAGTPRFPIPLAVFRYATLQSALLSGINYYDINQLLNRVE